MRILTFILIAVSLSACGRNYSNGSRVGTVQKLSEKGVIWKSWEGEMMLGGMVSKSNHNSKGEYTGTSSVPNVFKFNIDPSCVSKVKAAMKSGTRVELTYRQWLISPLTIESDYVVTDVSEAN